MFRVFSALSLLSISIFNGADLSKHFLRIHNGRDLTDGEYLYVISLIQFVDDESHRLCTGTMVTGTWGITAAHCMEEEDYYIWYGEFTVPPLQSKQYSKVLEVFMHPSYRSLSVNGGRDDLFVHNDVGLFRTQKVIKTSYGALSSVDHFTMIGLPVVYVGSGWSTTKPDDKDELRPLQIGEASIITCDAEMKGICASVICISPKCSNKFQRPWYGDSGGPLICDGKIIGVCSYGIVSNVLARSGYTPVSRYIEWIYHTMHLNDNDTANYVY